MVAITFRTRSQLISGADDTSDLLAADSVALAIGRAVPGSQIGIAAVLGATTRNFSLTVGADGTVPWTVRQISNPALAAALQHLKILSLDVGSGDTSVSTGGLTLTFTVP